METAEIITLISERRILKNTEKQEIITALERLESCEVMLAKFGIRPENLGEANPMGRYLTADERDTMIKISGVQGIIMQAIAGHKKCKRQNGLYLMLLTFALNSLSEAMKLRMTYLAMENCEKLVSDSKKYKTVVKPRDEAIREQKQFELIAEKTTVETDDFLDLVSWILAVGCQQCTNGTDEISACELRKMLMKYDVAPLYEDTGEHECPYQYGPEWKGESTVADAYMDALAKNAAG